MNKINLKDNGLSDPVVVSGDTVSSSLRKYFGFSDSVIRDYFKLSNDLGFIEEVGANKWKIK